MHRRILLPAAFAACFFASPSVAHASAIGPDAYGYTASDDYNRELRIASSLANGTETLILGNVDDSFVQVTLPFSFPFYGNAYNSVYISSNGLLTFGAGTANFSNQSLIGNLFGLNSLPMIAVMWDDWYTQPSYSSAVWYGTMISTGPTEFVVTWESVVPCCSNSSTDYVTFEAELFPNGDIQFNYSPSAASLRSQGNNATVGIRDANGNTNGRHLQWSHNQIVTGPIGDGEVDSIRFTLTPEPSTWALVGAGLFLTAIGARRKE